MKYNCLLPLYSHLYIFPGFIPHHLLSFPSAVGSLVVQSPSILSTQLGAGRGARTELVTSFDTGPSQPWQFRGGTLLLLPVNYY